MATGRDRPRRCVLLACAPRQLLLRQPGDSEGIVGAVASRTNFGASQHFHVGRDWVSEIGRDTPHAARVVQLHGRAGRAYVRHLVLIGPTRTRANTYVYR